MPSIQLLPDVLINKIAAGEVVERPAAVVKELVENALDAGATEIEVDLVDGGRKSVLVRDNGRGIPAMELTLAVSRHATSKITSLADLDNLQSLGFRGEALASIAAVSKMTIMSRRRDSRAEAHQIMIEGGTIVSQGEVGHPYGTSVLVKYLFYNTPARLKFLKTAETELSHIEDYLSRAALINPQVTFYLSHRGKRIFQVIESTDIKQRVLDTFGRDMNDSIYYFSGGSGGLEITGFAGHPQISRSHPREIYLFVNGRTVKDKVLYHATIEAYRDLLMKGRYPFVILFVKIPGGMVDVNVHPAKSEVRFSNSQVVHRAVYETIRKVLQAEPWKQDNTKERVAGMLESFETTCTPTLKMSEHHVYSWSQTKSQTAPQITQTTCISSELSHDKPVGVLTKQASFGKTAFSRLEIIGQFLNTYILCQAMDKLVLIDQHAAHERIGFEKIMLQYNQGGIATQQLLIPENFDLKPSDTEILKQYLKELKLFGLEIEFFGGHTFIVRSVPVLFRNIIIKDLVLDLIGDILEQGKLTQLSDRLHHIFATIACHGAIRANHRLTLQEMKALLSEMEEYQFSSFCPHGRPAFVEVTKYEIEKWFKRICS